MVDTKPAAMMARWRQGDAFAAADVQLASGHSSGPVIARIKRDMY